jgi:hypothetical protein
VDKARQAGWVIQSFATLKIPENAQERFLRSVADEVLRTEARAKLGSHRPCKILDKKVLSVRIPRGERSQIVLVEQGFGHRLD